MRSAQILDLKLAVLAKLHSPQVASLEPFKSYLCGAQGLEAMEVASSAGICTMEQFERWMSMESRTWTCLKDVK